MNTLSVNSASLQFLALIICLPFVISQKCTKNKPVILNIGDGNSDTGGFTAVTGLEDGHPYGRIFKDGPTGRPTDGRQLIDFLCESLHIDHLTPYLDGSSFANGANFAVLGACASPISNITRFIPIDLDTQTNQLKYFKMKSTELPHSKHTKTLPIGYFPNALYTLDIGYNDLSYFLNSSTLSLDQVILKIPSLIFNIKKAILEINNMGGKNIVVFNAPPFGCFPGELAVKQRNTKISKALDSIGCMKSLNDAAQAFNLQLKALCEKLRSQLNNPKIVYVDMFSIKYDLVANSKSYGFKNSLMACCGYGGAPYNFDPDSTRTCWTNKATIVCDKSDKYISWDGIHYTDAANNIIAEKINSAKYSTPPVKLSDLLCSNVGKSSTKP
ncbi:hypothetical protein CASFOL_010538 [Castilleja foliolosa]|uniref:Uncharacterized protein n=1 Tax=Castilleja foliolosa TaxID=1961234 RepID=A0ABD3DSW3_9LAMI